MLCLCSSINGQVIDPEKVLTSHVNLNKEIKVLSDSSFIIHITDLVGSSNLPWIKLGKTPMEKNNVYWGKITFSNNHPRVMSYYLYVGKNDYIDAYFVSNQEVIHHVKSGYLYTSYEKAVEAGSYYIPILLSANSDTDIYIRVEDPIHQSPEIDLKLYSNTQWSSHILRHYSLDLVFQIFLWLTILYCAFQYGSSGIREYFLYCLYLVALSVTFLFFTGILREFILKSAPLTTIYFIPFPLIAFSAYWVFVKNFLDLKAKVPPLDIRIKHLVLINFVLCGSLLVAILVTKDIFISTVLTQIGVAVNLCFAFWFVHQSSQAKHPLTKYYIGGTVLTLFLGTIELLMWDPNTSTAEIIQAGILIEVVIFSIGLGKKKRIIESEKQQALDKQINQLKLNESLAQWQKEELEKIIDSRTEKIKSKNRELKRAIQKANEAARVKSDFLSVMSHEIRTPMNAVIGTIHLLLSENPKKAQMDNLNTLKFSAENLLVLINDILDYSKVESGNVRLENIPFDLRELTRSIGQTYEARANESGILFNILIDQNIPHCLKSDPARLTQILNNLISNAIKFTPKGHVKLLINMIQRSANRVKVEFCVEDTGIGISRDKQDFVFESFTQAHADTTRIYGGTGLGLAITKKLVTLFESYITLESRPGKGSKFSFILDLEEATEGPIKEQIDNTEKILSIKDKNVLIVDDNTINLMMARKFINKWGMQCQTVESGKQALTAIFNHDFDLILMDLQMPEMDGYETSETIRSLESPSINSIPIIAVSADTYDNVHKKIAHAGMNDFLSKPFNPNELLNLVHKYCTAPIGQPPVLKRGKRLPK